MSIDSLREIRQMVLAALPYPPLPVEVKSVQGDSRILDVDKVASTHDLYGVCMNACVAKNDAKFNMEREKRQREVLVTFLHALSRGAYHLTGPALYNFYCDFSYRHLCCYFSENDRPQVWFKPHGYICKGDPAHKMMVSHLRGQRAIVDSETLEADVVMQKMKRKDSLDNCSVDDLLVKLKGLLATSE